MIKLIIAWCSAGLAAWLLTLGSSCNKRTVDKINALVFLPFFIVLGPIALLAALIYILGE